MLNNPLDMFTMSIQDVRSHFRSLLPVYQEDKHYMVLKGDIPVVLVAHMDTVPMGWRGGFPPYIHSHPQRSEVFIAPHTGLGADDRAGCLGIEILLSHGHRPWVILTDLEECGGVGAQELVIDIPSKPHDFYFMIQLDRRGYNDAVFYDMNTLYGEGKQFCKKVESYGFAEDTGTFSDISVIAPAWGVAAVNLSVGYHNEHTKNESWNYTFFISTVQKVHKMLLEYEQIGPHKYIAQYGAEYGQDLYYYSGRSFRRGLPWWEDDDYKHSVNFPREREDKGIEWQEDQDTDEVQRQREKHVSGKWDEYWAVREEERRRAELYLRAQDEERSAERKAERDRRIRGLLALPGESRSEDTAYQKGEKGTEAGHGLDPKDTSPWERGNGIDEYGCDEEEFISSLDHPYASGLGSASQSEERMGREDISDNDDDVVDMCSNCQHKIYYWQDSYEMHHERCRKQDATTKVTFCNCPASHIDCEEANCEELSQYYAG